MPGGLDQGLYVIGAEIVPPLEGEISVENNDVTTVLRVGPQDGAIAATIVVTAAAGFPPDVLNTDKLTGAVAAGGTTDVQDIIMGRLPPPP